MKRALVAILLPGLAAIAGPFACQAYDRGLYESYLHADAADVRAPDASDDASGGDTADAGDARSRDVASDRAPPRDHAAEACTPPIDAGDPCTRIPPTATTALGAVPAPLCDVPETTFRATDGFDHYPADASGVTGTATLQVGWSTAGLFVYVRVKKTTPIEYDPGSVELIYDYDAVEVFVAGGPPFEGPYGQGTNAFHFIATPPRPKLGGSMVILYFLQDAGTYTSPFVDFVSELLGPDEYAMEFLVPWSAVELSSPPATGHTIGFDLAVDYREASGDGGTYRFQTYLGLHEPAPEASTGPAAFCSPAHDPPSCDDRTWCRPRLE